MAKQTKPAKSTSSKAEETELNENDELSPKSKAKFADDDDDDGFELPMDDLGSFDDLSFDDDDDF